MAIKKASRKTMGRNQQVFVAKAINYTTDATLGLFIDPANTLGEFGVYDGNDARHTDAITSAEEFYFVLKTTQGIKRSPTYKLAEMVAKKKLYVAPVKQVSAVGWNRTGGSLNLATIVANNVYGLKVIEMTEGYDPYPTWNYEYVSKTGDTQMEIMQGFAKKINDASAPEHQQNQRLVSAKVTADATYGNYALTGTAPVLIVVNGSNILQIESGANDGAADIAVGDYIAFEPAATPSDSVGDIYKVIAKAAGNDAAITLNRPYTGASQTFTEAESEGTRVKKVTVVVNAGLELTAIDFDTFFKLAVNEELVNADFNTVTNYVRGNGTSDQVKALEKEGNTFAGETTQNAQFAESYGVQDDFVVAGETYDYYQFEFVKTERGIGLEVVHSERAFVTIAAAKSAGNVGSTLNTLFGL